MIIPKALLKLMIFNMGKTTTLLNKLSQKHIWDEEPVYCITTDIDWASEDVLNLFFNEIEKYQFNLDIFTTHNSKVIDQRTQSSRYTLYPHPNFCENSSHGGNKQEVIGRYSIASFLSSPIITEQAPQSPSLQPDFVPVKFLCWRK